MTSGCPIKHMLDKDSRYPFYAMIQNKCMEIHVGLSPFFHHIKLNLEIGTLDMLYTLSMCPQWYVDIP